MHQKKKLQVFLSSTYSDLREERQAAVEAILTAGHIPAGMELFAAGDESQMQVIRRWIEESDVFLLILGGRYGNLDTASEKSYIHLEYEHALSLSKPVVAVVIEDEYLDQRIKDRGRKAIESDHPDKLRAFREQVLTRVVRFWGDPRDIKLAILETLPELARRDELVGWVRGGAQVDFASLTEQISRLVKENTDLRAVVANTKRADGEAAYAGLSFEQMYKLLNGKRVVEGEFKPDEQERLLRIADIFGDEHVALVHVFFMLSNGFLGSANIPNGTAKLKACQRLAEYGVLRWVHGDNSGTRYGFNEAGHKFFVRLYVERDASAAEQYRDVA
jgi:hypothetical protein